MSKVKLRIDISYQGRWCHAFANEDGKSLTSSTMLGRKGSYMTRDITKFTVRGLLQRLIGDQRRYRSIANTNSDYFKGLIISHKKHVDCVNHEVVYLRNISPSKDPSGFNGSVLSNLPQFTAECASEFWGVADLTIEGICDFILNEKAQAPKTDSLDVLVIADKFSLIKKRKAIVNEGRIKKAIDKVSERFPTGKYTKEGSDKVTEISLYVAALYINAQRLAKRGFKTETFFTKNGNISGFSRHNFNAYSDFMSSRTTGGYKEVYGNPYLANHGHDRLIKEDGTLSITINANKDKAIEIITLIENAGVACCKLGKKGFAYISNMSMEV